MRPRLPTAPALAVLLLLPAALLCADDASKGDKDLDGDWQGVSAVRDGKELPPPASGNPVMTVKGESAAMKIGDMTSAAAIKVDATKTPRTLDVTPEDGPEKGKTVPCIYEIKGDELARLHRRGGHGPADGVLGQGGQRLDPADLQARQEVTAAAASSPPHRSEGEGVREQRPRRASPAGLAGRPLPIREIASGRAGRRRVPQGEGRPGTGQTAIRQAGHEGGGEVTARSMAEADRRRAADLPSSGPRRYAPFPAGKGNVIQLHDVKARVARLRDLTRGLAKEAAVWKAGEDPLLYLERQPYLNTR